MSIIRRTSILVTLLLLVLAVTACSSFVFETNDYLEININELKSNPEIYINEKLLIKGYISSQFDGYVDKNYNPVTNEPPFCLYTNRKTALAFNGKKCISISWDYNQKIDGCINEFATFYAELGEYYLSTKKTTTDLGLVNIVAVHFESPSGLNECF